jgi:hypothetical protein
MRLDRHAFLKAPAAFVKSRIAQGVAQGNSLLSANVSGPDFLQTSQTTQK